MIGPMSVVNAIYGRLPRVRGVAAAIYAYSPRLHLVRKAEILSSYDAGLRKKPLVALRYLVSDPELTNFTYPIANQDELAQFVADATGIPVAEVIPFLNEVEQNALISRTLANSPSRILMHKRHSYFGRRLIWYAIARIMKPEVIVETGIHDGLGSVLLLAALQMNAEDGVERRLISVDIAPSSGWLIPTSLKGRWTSVFGSTFDVLEGAVAGHRIGMFIHDSDHTYECEKFEFTTALAHAADTITLISDNSHATSALRDICRENDIRFEYFAEKTQNHFYPGAGNGVAIARNTGNSTSTA